MLQCLTATVHTLPASLGISTRSSIAVWYWLYARAVWHWPYVRAVWHWPYVRAVWHWLYVRAVWHWLYAMLLLKSLLLKVRL